MFSGTMALRTLGKFGEGRDGQADSDKAVKIAPQAATGRRVVDIGQRAQ